MERLKDDFHRRKDGSIDYDYYNALAVEFRRQERKRLVLALIARAIRFIRRAAVNFGHAGRVRKPRGALR